MKNKRPLKILHTVEFYFPSIGGAQEVVRRLSEHMAAEGHDVTVATSKLPERKSLVHNGVKLVEFAVSGNITNGIKGEKKLYQEFLRTEKFDVVMNYAAQQWTADAFFEVIDDVKAKKVFVPCGYSALYDPAYADYFEKLPDILKKYDATVYLSDDYRDINFAREHGVNNTKLIPNGADEEEFGVIDEAENRSFRTRYGVGGLTLITIGNHTNEKGHRELLNVFRKLPISKATLVIVGILKPHDGCFDECEIQAEHINRSRKFLGKRVILLDGSNRQEVIRAMKASDICVFLSNIEASPLALFEASAAGLPFIATAAGNSAEIAQWLGNGIIVKSNGMPNGRVSADFKNALLNVSRLAHQPAQRKALGATGRKNWLKKYTWGKLADEYLKLYENIIKSDT